MNEDKRLGDLLETARKYRGEEFWNDYLGNHFCRLSMTQRAEELSRWDDLLEKESALTREHAELLQRKRQLNDLHFHMLAVDR